MIKIMYSKIQLEETARFIAANNNVVKSLPDPYSYVKNIILKNMRYLATHPNAGYTGTLGFTIIGDRVYEGIDDDANEIYIDIGVNIALGKGCWNEENSISEIVDDDMVSEL